MATLREITKSTDSWSTAARMFLEPNNTSTQKTKARLVNARMSHGRWGVVSTYVKGNKAGANNPLQNRENVNGQTNGKDISSEHETAEKREIS